MSLQTVLRSIESHDFAARLAVANTMDMLFDIAQREQPVKELLTLLEDREQAHNFVTHIGARLREQEDVRYRNSRDIAFAISIWALNRAQPALAKLLAAQVLSSPRLWWARRAAMEYGVGASFQPVSTFDESHTVTVMKNDWGTVDTQGKDVLIITAPPADLIVRDQILNAGAVAATSDAVETQKSMPGEFTTDGSQTAGSTMVQR